MFKAIDLEIVSKSVSNFPGSMQMGLGYGAIKPKGKTKVDPGTERCEWSIFTEQSLLLNHRQGDKTC